MSLCHGYGGRVRIVFGASILCDVGYWITRNEYQRYVCRRPVPLLQVRGEIFIAIALFTTTDIGCLCARTGCGARARARGKETAIGPVVQERLTAIVRDLFAGAEVQVLRLRRSCTVCETIGETFNLLGIGDRKLNLDILIRAVDTSFDEIHDCLVF